MGLCDSARQAPPVPSFSQLDANGDGVITQAEYEQAARYLSPAPRKEVDRAQFLQPAARAPSVSAHSTASQPSAPALLGELRSGLSTFHCIMFGMPQYIAASRIISASVSMVPSLLLTGTATMCAVMLCSPQPTQPSAEASPASLASTANSTAEQLVLQFSAPVRTSPPSVGTFNSAQTPHLHLTGCVFFRPAVSGSPGLPRFVADVVRPQGTGVSRPCRRHLLCEAQAVDRRGRFRGAGGGHGE
jgi:hypothetical protein